MSNAELEDLEQRIADTTRAADEAEERAQAYREAGYDRAAQREFSIRVALDRRVVRLMQELPGGVRTRRAVA